LALATLATTALLATSAPVLALPALAGAGPRCQPAARLDGDEALVLPLGRMLRARGVTPSALPGECRPVEVEIEGDARTGLQLSILDADGRSSRRLLSSVEAAALVIESWSRAGQSAPLPAEAGADEEPAPPLQLPTAHFTASAPGTWSATAEPAAPSASVTSPAPVERPAAASLRASAPPHTLPLAPSLVSLSLAGESAVAFDRSSWWGGSAGVCLHTGPLCTGLVARYGRARSLAAAAPRAHQEVDLTVTTQVALALGPVRIVPSLGLGFGRSLTTFANNPALGAAATVAGAGRRMDGDRRGGRGGDGRRSEGRSGRDNAGDNGASTPGGESRGAAATPAMPPGRSAQQTDGATTQSTADAGTRRADRLLGHAGLVLSLPLTAALAVDFGISLGMALTPAGAGSVPRERLRGGVGLRYGGP
jgi:hypothetical protein